jgi:ribosomal protein S13
MKTIRILSTSINVKKPMAIALTAIYGIGRARTATLLKNLLIDPKRRLEELHPGERYLLNNELEKLKKGAKIEP